MHSYYFDRAKRTQFLEEFDRRLQGRVDRTTIGWIWDQYSTYSRNGKGYSLSNNPLTHLREFEQGKFGDFDLKHFQDELRRVTAEVEASEGKQRRVERNQGKDAGGGKPGGN